ncbi:MAG: M81 family metallopeptidase [Alphaproteobacteria bacterium]|nr:M81 family metallopeptidase [Alphaproteobacteria bacterium]
MSQPRIALGALLFEGNTLSPVITGHADFASKYLASGVEIPAKLASTNTEVGGALEVFRSAEVEIVPLIATHGGAGGRVAGKVYRAFRDELLERIRSAGRLDGVYLALHGAFIAEGTDDAEGEILAAVREIIGHSVPIAVSCDLHGHITPAMTRHAQILIGYREYPHDDTHETGARAATLLLRTIRGQIRPVSRFRRAPMILPAQRQRTKGDGPMREIIDLARGREADGTVLAASYFCVQPWLDLPGVGVTAVTVADGDAAAADRVAEEMVQLHWRKRREFLVPTEKPADAIRKGRALSGGPVILADAADCVGGGASGDSSVVLRALLEHAPDQSAAIHIVDPDMVVRAREAGVGKRFRATLGNHTARLGGPPLQAEVLVERVEPKASFRYSGGLMGGVEASIGDAAVLAIGPIKVLCASLSSYEYADEPFQALGIDVRRMKFLVVKNPMNYQQAYAGAPAMFVLDTPGPTTCNLASVAWKRLDRPCFPMEDGFEPVFATG